MSVYGMDALLLTWNTAVQRRINDLYGRGLIGLRTEAFLLRHLRFSARRVRVNNVRDNGDLHIAAPTAPAPAGVTVCDASGGGKVLVSIVSADISRTVDIMVERGDWGSCKSAADVRVMVSKGNWCGCTCMCGSCCPHDMLEDDEVEMLPAGTVVVFPAKCDCPACRD